MTLYALKAAEKFGKRINDIAKIETEFVELGDKKKKISTAALCKMVNGRYECSEHDYITGELLPKMMEADGLHFSFPAMTPRKG